MRFDKTWALLIAAILIALSMVSGCKPADNPGPSPTETPSETEAPSFDPDTFEIPEKLENLIPDPTFSTSTEGWTFEGAVAINTGVSRNKKDDKSVRFTGFGYALFKASNVPAGKYTLRYFLYDKGPVRQADMVVFVNGQRKLSMSYNQRGWWSEYATGAFDVPEGASVSIKLTVDGGEGLVVDLDEVYLLKVPYDIPEPVAGENPVSRLVKREDGTYYIEVHGKPFLWRGAHASDSVVEDVNILARKIKEAGYNVFTRGVHWRTVQPTAAPQYDFSVIDAIIRAANENDMYADIVWAGSMFCGNTHTATPGIRGLHDVHAKDPVTGLCEQKAIDKQGKDLMCMADFANEKLLEIEGRVFKALIDYIAEKDTERRIISIQIENEPAESIYNSKSLTFENLARHINYLGKIVKESDHPMIVRVNHGFGNAAHFIFNTPYIDMNGTDPYWDNIGIINRSVKDTFNSRIGHLSENGGYENSSAQLASAYAMNGYVAIYPVGPDTYWNRPGLYGPNFEVLSLTERIRDLNLAAEKITPVLARAPYNAKAAFNTSDSGVISNPVEVKKLNGIAVRMEALEANGATGIAVVEGNYVYCIADRAAFFSVFGEGVKTYTGAFNEDGVFVADKELRLQDAKDGSFRAEYTPQTAIRFEFSKAVEPDPNTVPEPPKLDVESIPAIDAPIGENLIRDPSFETGIENNWTVTTDYQVLWTQNPGSIPDGGGEYAVNFWNDSVARGNTTMTYDVGVVPKGTYVFDFMMRGKYGEGDLKVQIIANGSVYLEHVINPTDVYEKYSLPEIRFDQKAKVRIAFVIKLSGQTNAGWSYMDLVNFRRVSD